ncbi:uracil-DNA glycosylase family protein [Shewanella yunxiaonensis]|uniref:Uracil-DNA glycosylase family protein n=1 Tax=Shewanella yunxiaonensis TaxID=2829809 RepID=A0ABX7YWH7_9GAMM|nr:MULTISPECIES: uracil-DNA glycosylase family protein [Shewanella]MDF0534341.1 uracil-DNA glycosylase family protein [Shewanella sp. A32]QUN07123.1 uracil-DNA glycosylase family protein [Shewanella yunxiaonensis]
MKFPSDSLLQQVRACSLCREFLPLPPKPILQAATPAKILIAGQAPGRVTHERGLPFDDVSGDRLRLWLGVSREQFYDPQLFALVPMGFCYPGTQEKQGRRQGDLPPRPECARQWRQQLLNALPNIQLTLLLGKYAMAWHLAGTEFAKANLAQAVAAWESLWPKLLVLPHPSPRNRLWLKQHPLFEQTLLPLLQQRIAELING